MKQYTIRNTVNFHGIGLHTGNPVNVWFKPAEQGMGVVFCRTDLPGKPVIPAEIKFADGSNYAIDLIKGNIKVRTVEHVLAAVFAEGIDNLLIELDNEEFPICDGSAREIIKMLDRAGKKIQEKEQRRITPKHPIYCYTAQLDQRAVMIHPGIKLSINYMVKYKNPVIGSQSMAFFLNRLKFRNEIAGARTFGWSEEIAKQKKSGMIKGGSLKNALVFTENSLRNKNGLRYEDEPVRHKIIDLLGAIALLPGRLEGQISAVKSGHKMDIELMKKIVKGEQEHNARIKCK